MRQGLWLIAFVSLAAGLAKAQPNIVFILADDLGWSDVGYQGTRRHKTPNIDTLAREGLVFSNFHTSPNCAPTRAALMSGQYAPRTGIYSVDDAGRFDTSRRPVVPVPNRSRLPLETTTVAQALNRLGYKTGMFGKWHLGEDGDYHPSKRGFDEAITTSIDKHYGFTTTPNFPHRKGQYLADFLTDRAVDFIHRHKDGPFFLYLPHLAVHRPMQADSEIVREYLANHPNSTKSEAIYAAMVASLDASVGRIRKAIRDCRIEKETVIIFCSDNGGVGGYRREGLDTEELTDNSPLRGGKGSLYEGGVRVPFLICWPGKIVPGSVCDLPAIHVDMFPTLVQLAGGKISADAHLDGQSLLPWIFDQPNKPDRDPIFQHFPGYLGLEGKPDQWRTLPVSVIQSGSWKLMEFLEDGRLELYNLATDPGETSNLAETHSAKTEELRSRLVEWRERIQAPMPKRKQSKS